MQHLCLMELSGGITRTGMTKDGIGVQCNGVYKNLLTKILSGYFFAETRTSGGYPTLVYSILLNIATQLELRKATHAAKLELLEATLVALESYKRRCTVAPTLHSAPL